MHKHLKISIFVVLFLVFLLPQVANSAWYDTDFGYCRKITTTAGTGGFATTTTNGYVTLATTTLSATTANGGKIAKLDSNDNLPLDVIYTNGTDCNNDSGTLLDFHHESYNQTTGDIVSWIELTDVSSTTAKNFLVYYGNSSATDQSDEAGTYNSTYAGVWHLGHDGTATTTSPDFLDSTSNNNDGTSNNMNAADLVDGQMDGALDFDGDNDYIHMGNNFDYTSEDFSIGYWVKLDTLTTDSVGQGPVPIYKGNYNAKVELDDDENNLKSKWIEYHNDNSKILTLCVECAIKRKKKIFINYGKK